MQYVLIFHSNDGYVNALQCYVVPTVPVLFGIVVVTHVCCLKKALWPIDTELYIAAG